MIRIFPDRIRIRSDLEGFLSVHIRFRIFNIHIRIQILKVIFLWCQYPLQFYPAKTNTICIRTKIWKQIRYEYIRSYSIHLHPYQSLPHKSQGLCYLTLVQQVQRRLLLKANTNNFRNYIASQEIFPEI